MGGPNFTERAIAYLKGIPSDNGGPTIRLSRRDSPVIKPFATGLHICYLVDKGQSYDYIQNYHLAEHGITMEQLHQIGLRNLSRLLRERNFSVQSHGNIFAFLAGGDFEASVMLLDEFWEGEFRQYTTRKFAVAVPSRDVMAFCDASSEAGISELMDVVNRVWPTGDHLVSNKIYVRESSEWSPLSAT